MRQQRAGAQALIHGDEHDQITTCTPWLSVTSDVSYHFLIRINRALSWTCRKLVVPGH